MAEILCESVSPGMRPDERGVRVRDVVTGNRTSLRVPTDFLTFYEGKYYLPVGVVQEELQQGLALVEVTDAPDAGAWRLWVRTSDLLPRPEPVMHKARGVVRGNTIKLDRDLELVDGQVAHVTVQAVWPPEVVGKTHRSKCVRRRSQ